jgi:hypothetical protein
MNATEFEELFTAVPLPVGTTAAFTGELVTVRVPLPDGRTHETSVGLQGVPDGVARTRVQFALEKASMASKHSRSALRVRRVQSVYLGVRLEVLDSPEGA